ncbi:MAG: class I SAM-dependent methyltransferase [Patiriisocius sp.]|uniref:class I SAM-dependent methyltransferase n=1 Tax=Patiriisocius sp. TaxID=2822396 RepID=UPI003EF2AB1F
MIQDILNIKRNPNYLEIGTYTGISLLPAKAWNKIAIDPKFKISRKRKLKWALKNTTNLTNRFFEKTSDAFFAENKAYLKKRAPFDLMFVDGLHTFRASLQDVLNCLSYLDKDGIVMMHDCFPPNEVAALPANSFQEVKNMKLEGFTFEWCGDVWKTIYYLKKKYPKTLLVDVVNTDYGLGIVRFNKKTNEKFSIDEVLFKEINCLTYNDLKSNLDWISLKEILWVENELLN